jgi:hypothetical protein
MSTTLNWRKVFNSNFVYVSYVRDDIIEYEIFKNKATGLTGIVSEEEFKKQLFYNEGMK